jgi:hypothetical protein
MTISITLIASPRQDGDLPKKTSSVSDVDRTLMTRNFLPLNSVRTKHQAFREGLAGRGCLTENVILHMIALRWIILVFMCGGQSEPLERLLTFHSLFGYGHDNAIGICRKFPLSFC